MWEILLTLLILLLSILWWMASKQPCSPVADEEERVKFLLTLLVESRWSGLTYKLLHRHRHHRGLMNADVPMAAEPAAAAVAVALPALPLLPVDPLIPPLERPAMEEPAMAQPAAEPPEIPQTANTPLCPHCGHPMVMRRTRRSHGLVWGCAAHPQCRGTRRPGDRGDEPQQQP